MAVGFKLPPGAVTVFGYSIRPEARPWGPSGGSIFGAGSPDPHGDPSGFERWQAAIQERYGVDSLSFPGLHHTDYQSALEQIARRDFQYFNRAKLGNGTGEANPSWEEVIDLQAWNGHGLVLERARELFELDGGGVPVPGGPVVVTPAPPPAPIASGPPLSPLAVRVEELRVLWFNHAPESPLDTFLADGWEAIQPFAVEGLRVWRLLRRFLGDGRPLPPEE